MSAKTNTDQAGFPLLEQYLNYMQAVKERSPLTMKEYRYDLIMFFRFLKRDRGLTSQATPFSEISLADIDINFIQTISTDDLFAFLIYLSRERQASAPTRARKAATLKSFFKYLCQKRKLLKEDPAYELDTPKRGKRLPKYLSLDESLTLLSTAASEDQQNRVRDYCILTLFLNCGLRLSELSSLDLSNLRDTTLTVVGKGNKERTIYLNDASKEALQNWLNLRPNSPKEPKALFISRLGRRLSNQMIQHATKRLLAESGLDPRKYSVHKLRHTAATLMYQYGQVDIRSLQLILGHASVATTQIYTHVDDKSLQEAAAKNPLGQIESPFS